MSKCWRTFILIRTSSQNAIAGGEGTWKGKRKMENVLVNNCENETLKYISATNLLISRRRNEYTSKCTNKSVHKMTETIEYVGQIH